MAKHKLFCVPGTWEAAAAADGNPGGITPDAEIGMLRGVTDLLNRGNLWRQHPQHGRHRLVRLLPARRHLRQCRHPGTYLKQGYDLVTPLSLMDPFAMIAQIAANLVGWLESGELGPLSIFRAVKTGFDLGVFLRDNPHDKYGVWDIIPGWTALRHSANHLNFWGPRLPTTLNV